MARIITPLTNTQVEKSKYSTTANNELNDGGGLFLELYPSGAKRWRFRYNAPTTGKRTKFTIGDYPALSIADARNKREEYKSLLAQGMDPQLHIQQEKQKQELAQNNTFLAIAEKWKAKKAAEIEPKTLTKYWRSLELHVFPFIGSYPIEQVTPALVLIPLKRVEERNTIDMAHRLAMYINEILNFSVNAGIIPFNNCLKVNKSLKKHQKQNNPHIETQELNDFMRDVARARMQKQTKNALLFKMLTMVRSTEATSAEWSEINFDENLWIIPAERMKARNKHIVPLSRQAIQILKEMYTITGHLKYIFPKRGEIHKPMTPDALNNALRRMGYQGKQTAHGLRGLVRTHLGEEGVREEHSEMCLAHKTGNNVSKAYNHATYLKQRIPIMQQWGDYVEQCAKGTGLFD
ncbi:DUF4102 domain-containing protein [Pasteurella multocida]|uniref:tyrosine-type recombinase/integrase n=1 Tax=Pasteurella multocida TaxID=747 RepID=UPI0013569A06|nr:integrase arm-type DNA-binding domain-containing protein [Pasteurella multocida]NAT88456.1 DUF4102 domain-containing protein [Pasteurella multocida]